MAAVVKLVGVVTIVVATMYAVRPAILKKMARYWMKENNVYLGGAISIVIGIIFLFGASRCALAWIIVLMGILSFVKGVIIFMLGKDRLAPFMERLLKKPNKALRAIAVLGILIGVIIVYAA